MSEEREQCEVAGRYSRGTANTYKCGACAARNARIAELERQVDHLTSETHRWSDGVKEEKGRTEEAEKRAIAAEARVKALEGAAKKVIEANYTHSLPELFESVAALKSALEQKEGV